MIQIKINSPSLDLEKIFLDSEEKKALKFLIWVAKNFNELKVIIKSEKDETLSKISPKNKNQKQWEK